MGSFTFTPPFATIDQAQFYVQQAGEGEDADIDIMATSLALSFFDHIDADIEGVWQAYIKMVEDLKNIFDTLCLVQNGDGAAIQAMALKQVMASAYGYIGDDIAYDDLRNINMYSVMDRRMGMPISLCIIAISLCRALGWQADGMNFPGHFLMRLEKDGERLMIDPFQGCPVLEAKDLRKILKKVMGEGAELSADYYIPCTNRDILLRYQNNLKFRLIDKGQYSKALDIVKRMSLIAPDDFRLRLDKAVLYARLEQAIAAIEQLHIYLDHVTDPYDKSEAEQFLSDLQKQLN